MIVELHMLQNFAPSCLNRDDTNTPKDAEFGGHRRARISSQCIKRAVRWHPRLRNDLAATFALRSNDHARQIAKLLSEDPKTPRAFDEALQVGRYMFQRMGLKEKNGRLTVMLILGSDEIRALTEAAAKNWEELSLLANANLLWERLAERIAGLLGDDIDSAMLGHLIANHRAGTANATQLGKWLDLPETVWAEALVVVHGMSKELKQELRDKFAADVEGDDAGDKDDDEDEYVPKTVASLFKGNKNKDVIDKLKGVDIKGNRGDKKAGTDPEGDPKKKEVSKLLKSVFGPLTKLKTKAVDVALFGRMLAEIKSGDMNVNAACQVAHALSTNRVSMEMDYFTAVDDLKDLARDQGVERNAGAGMIGTVEFNSSCFYRYANIDTKQLTDNLGGNRELIETTVAAFIRASIEAIPTGKQNSMAAQNPPSLVLVVVRKSGMWSLANAFVKPVAGEKEGLVVNSISALDGYWGRLTKMFGTPSGLTAAVATTEEGHLSNLSSFKKDSVDAVIKTVTDQLNKEGQS